MLIARQMSSQKHWKGRTIEEYHQSGNSVDARREKNNALCRAKIDHRTKALWAKKNDWAKEWPVFFSQSFSCLKTAYFRNAARTVRSPGFLGFALQRAVVKQTTVRHLAPDGRDFIQGRKPFTLAVQITSAARRSHPSCSTTQYPASCRHSCREFQTEYQRRSPDPL